MNKWIVCALLLFPLLARADDRKATDELLAAENHWLAVEDDPDALESILAPDFLHVVPQGIITKEEQIGFMRRHPRPDRPAPERHFEDLPARVYGNVGIVNGVVVATEGGTTRRTAFTDVFEKRGGKWWAVNAQETPLSTP